MVPGFGAVSIGWGAGGTGCGGIGRGGLDLGVIGYGLERISANKASWALSLWDND